MRRTILILLVSGFTATIWSQVFNTPLSLISSAGGQGQVTVQSQALNVEWTIGEPFIGVGSVSNQSIVIGEQQGIRNEIGVSTSDLNIDNLRVYPNPAHRHLQIDNLPDGIKQINLYSTNGSFRQSYTTSDTHQTISTFSLPSGLYVLAITHELSLLGSFKITIINN